jgi:hypothetical protein
VLAAPPASLPPTLLAAVLSVPVLPAVVADETAVLPTLFVLVIVVPAAVLAVVLPVVPTTVLGPVLAPPVPATVLVDAGSSEPPQADGNANRAHASSRAAARVPPVRATGSNFIRTYWDRSPSSRISKQGLPLVGKDEGSGKLI